MENTAKGITSGTVLSDSSLELTRYYDRAEYEIVFDTSGGVDLKPLKAKYGTLITLPTASKYGYEFAGWYVDEALTEPCTFTKMPANGATVYAKWATMGADRGNEYVINSIRVTDGNGTYITDKLPEKIFYAEISVENVASKYMDTTILAAYDKDNRLVSLHYMTATSQIGQTVIFGANIDNTEGNIVSLKAFITPVFNGGLPVAKAVTFESKN